MESFLYFIAILPPDSVCAEVRSVQHDIASRFGPRRAMQLPVHITVEPPFRLPPSQDALLEERLTHFFQKESAFELELKNYGTFRQDVLFIDVNPTLALLEMQARLSRFLRDAPALIRSEPFHEGYKPHLTLANRDIDSHTHHRLWSEFNTRKFFARFVVEGIALLRHENKEWKVVRNFALQNDSKLNSLAD